MDSHIAWQLFMETGAPEMYLIYNQARKAEMPHVFDNSGIGAESHKVQ